MTSASIPARRPHVVILNAALAGDRGNTATALALTRRLLARRAQVTVVTLAKADDFTALLPTLAAADGFLLGTGTHWDSWSSVLQQFLEAATPTEGTSTWLGKPASVVVTEHSVGGKGVLSRLQGVLLTLGCSLPPMSGLVLSRSALISALHDAAASRDFWCADDLKVVTHNLVEAATGRNAWRAWPADRTDFRSHWASELVTR